MRKDAVKRPVYDEYACLLYDYMISQSLTEEIIVQHMGLDEEQKRIWGEEIYNRAPWQPVATWIEHPISIPRHYILSLCEAVNAPVDAVFTKSKILNNIPFSFCGYGEKQGLENIPSDELVVELKQRGYKVYREV